MIYIAIAIVLYALINKGTEIYLQHLNLKVGR